MKIEMVKNSNFDFLHLCKKLDDVHNEIVAEQRYPNSNCCVGNEKYTSVYVMYVDNEAVGCLALTDVKDGVVVLGRVYVMDEYRKHGIATKLFDCAVKDAKANGAKTMILDTYSRLVSAVNLYEKLGFTVVPQLPGLEDFPYSICMAKQL